MRAEPAVSSATSFTSDAARRPARVAIVTEVRLYREGLVQLLQTAPGIEVVGAAAPDDPTLAQLAELKPDVVLLDTSIIRTGHRARELARLVPDARTVAFAVAEENEDEVLACAEAGVAGFVGRDAATTELVDVVLSAARGEVHCSQRVTALFLRRIAGQAHERVIQRDTATLTRREREVLRLIDDDLSNKEIAGRLGIEVATVKNHVHNILGKCKLRRRGEVAALIRDKAL
jgi:two-component system nitrate/nitrite response regulator NarL